VAASNQAFFSFEINSGFAYLCNAPKKSEPSETFSFVFTFEVFVAR
jgi:hypothetical protein